MISIKHEHWHILVPTRVACPADEDEWGARTFVGLLNDSMQFENDCEQNTNSRSATNTVVDKINKSAYIVVIPNPADNDIDITIKNIIGENCKLEIINTLGSVIYSQLVNCHDTTIKVKTVHYIPGIYSVRIISDNVYSNTVKLVIAR